MRRTLAWFKARFAKPYFVHRGVPVYHVFHTDGEPLHFQFSWVTTRNRGDRVQPGECFDVRQLPGYSERPPTGDFFVWNCLRDRDIRRQIMELIDICLEDGDGPWLMVDAPLFDFRGLFSALGTDFGLRRAHGQVSAPIPKPEMADRRKPAPSVHRSPSSAA